MGELYLGQENILSTKQEQMCVITNNLTVLTVQGKVKPANRNHFLPDNNSYTWSSTPDTDLLATKMEKKQDLSFLTVNGTINPNNSTPLRVIRIFIVKSCDTEILLLLCLSVGMDSLGPLDLSSDILYLFPKPDYFPKTTQSGQQSPSFTGIE